MIVLAGSDFYPVFQPQTQKQAMGHWKETIWGDNPVWRTLEVKTKRVWLELPLSLLDMYAYNGAT